MTVNTGQGKSSLLASTPITTRRDDILSFSSLLTKAKVAPSLPPGGGLAPPIPIVRRVLLYTEPPEEQRERPVMRMKRNNRELLFDMKNGVGYFIDWATLTVTGFSTRKRGREEI
ncbi:MAG: hypothetical protein QXF17_06770 [Ignisphaera sp.]